MNSQCQHLLERMSRCVRIEHTFFAGPRPPSSCFYFLLRVGAPCLDATGRANLRLAICRRVSLGRGWQLLRAWRVQSKESYVVRDFPYGSNEKDVPSTGEASLQL